MIDHLSLGVRDLDRAAAFYDPVMATLGCTRFFTRDRMIAWGLGYPSLTVQLPRPEEGENAVAAPGVHVAFQAATRAAVHAFYAAALGHGGRDDGPPGLRSYAPTYYAAFVRDPDGHRIEAVTYAEQ